MFEVLRKLTANYSEEEYKAWLNEEPEDIQWHPTPAFKFTEDLIKGGFHRMKDFDIALHDIAEETGYEYEFLNKVFSECDEDEPYIDRIIEISDIALEHDF